MKTSQEIVKALKRLQEKLQANEKELDISEIYEEITGYFNKYYSGKEEIKTEEIQALLPEYEKTLKLLEVEKEKILREIEKVKQEKKVINSYLTKSFHVEGVFLDKKR
ncbi:hypothetical protein ciss_20850 [Carboxydothermus islandicus]|uniref:Uncharacterized protein n=1 Tax=Carboxydothermus islandicus TaxID=661089 RepID=A0A1L8D4Q7_9THEO|nr:hypothetical protein [Carboxydothermus islandicus]GAV26152.1 hypothetical protein ciss_20850 [Carboxydothermus islandicus]